MYISFETERGTWQFNTAARSLFDGAMAAIRWFNEWYGPRPSHKTILMVEAGDAKGQQEFRVNARRVVEHFGLNPSDWLDA